MASFEKVIASIVSTTADYREADGEGQTPERVQHWIEQFDATARLPILNEIDHVLKQTYFSRLRTTKFLGELLKSPKLAGKDPCAFWKGVKFLDIQGGGASQTQMLALFGKLLKANCGLEISKCGSNSQTFMYIDDATFSGNRLKQDLERWIVESAPPRATVHIVMIAMHMGAKQYAEGYAKRNILSVARGARKDITFHWWCELVLENQMNRADVSDVLWPVQIPDDPIVADYVASLKHKPRLRNPGHVGEKGVFSTDEARQLLEEQFLKAGVRIRNMCRHLNKYQRPLGNSVLETLGFGSLVVSFRNCPNNAPLALWAGDPWVPLFPRTTNSDTSFRQFLEMLERQET